MPASGRDSLQAARAFYPPRFLMSRALEARYRAEPHRSAVPSCCMQIAGGLSQVDCADRAPQGPPALCYGRYDLLLLTRQWMLVTLGCRCYAARNFAEFQAAIRRESPAIIVLCQTLTGEQVSEAARFAAEHSPQSHLVVMFTGAAKCIPQQPHTLLPSAGGPKAFSEMMSGLLGRSSAPGARLGSEWTSMLPH